MQRSLIILLAGAALASLGAGAALADETTVVHEQREVIPPAPQGTVVQQSTQESEVHAVSTAPARHHVVLHRRVHHVAVRHTVAASARPHAADAAASVQSRTVQSDTVQTAPAPAPSVVDKRTVIHHDDQGNTETHTRVIHQDSSGVTTVEHRSTEQTATPPPTPAP